jgi:CelD/BcsL family acetyltransferase involved in cellulose biosynthesis
MTVSSECGSATHKPRGFYDAGIVFTSCLSNRIHPLTDARWAELVKRHPRSSVFHTREWLEALRRTYGYEPVAMTTCSPGTPLTNAVVSCRVESRITGRRLVSLPFSDHCDLLTDDTGNATAMISALRQELRQQKLGYVEIRPTRDLETTELGAKSTYSFCFHQIDLRPQLDTLFENCHKDSTQRKIRRAEREGLVYEEGRSAFLLDSFYRLLLITRRRHFIPPQPKRWFQNLIDCFGDALKIQVAVRGKSAIAAILTLRHKDTIVYKYGCSDAHYHPLGGMHLLFWRTIQQAKADGLSVFDLGRSNREDIGLVTFKDRWGAKRSNIDYLRLLPFAESKAAYGPAGDDWKSRIAKRAFPWLPDRVLCAAGDLLYRHIG